MGVRVPSPAPLNKLKSDIMFDFFYVKMETMNIELDLSKLNIITERLIIRNWQASDLEDMYLCGSNLKVAKMAGFVVHQNRNYTKMLLERFMSSGSNLAVEYQNHVIASIIINKYPENILPEFKFLRGCDLGFALSEEYWGQGIMLEALKPLIDYLFFYEDLDFISCGHFITNTQSKRLKEKLGFIPYRHCLHVGPYDDSQETCLSILYRPKA